MDMDMTQEQDTMPTATNNQIGLAIATSEARLTRAFQQGVAQLNTSIRELTDTHHASLLEQERRNAGFATATALTLLDTRVRSIETVQDGRAQQLNAQTAAIERIEAALSSLQHQVEQASSNVFSSLAGWAIMALISVAGVTLSVLLVHLVK